MFTDGEELGEVGVQSFVNEHPWAREASVLWNMDGGGNCGPATFNTPNAWAFQEIKTVLPHPVIASIGEELAKLGPVVGGRKSTTATTSEAAFTWFEWNTRYFRIN